MCPDLFYWVTPGRLSTIIPGRDDGFWTRVIVVRIKEVNGFSIDLEGQAAGLWMWNMKEQRLYGWPQVQMGGDMRLPGKRKGWGSD